MICPVLRHQSFSMESSPRAGKEHQKRYIHNRINPLHEINSVDGKWIKDEGVVVSNVVVWIVCDESYQSYYPRHPSSVVSQSVIQSIPSHPIHLGTHNNRFCLSLSHPSDPLFPHCPSPPPPQPTYNNQPFHTSPPNSHQEYPHHHRLIGTPPRLSHTSYLHR